MMPAKLLLVGDGPDRPRIEEMCRKTAICHDIRFLGKQDPVEELLAISDLFLMPSESESFGLAALEAMACQVPVISSNAGGIPEINIHGKTGYLSKVGDVDDMAKNAFVILSSDEALKQFRHNAYERSKEFDIEKILPQYEQYYQRVLAASEILTFKV